MKYYIVDAFTEQPFGGNTAGVVILEDNSFPADSMMLKIAAELRYSETAFVRNTGQNAFHIRYFTPTGEVDLCGHATIASFALLHSIGMASGTCQLHTLAGDLTVEAGKKVMMQMTTPKIVSTLDAEEVCQSVGIDVCTPLPVQIVSTGLPDIMLPVKDVATLNALHPDMEAVSILTQRLGALSIHPFALSSDGHTAHVRDFAPACGIPEESATGTANAALTHYLATHGIITPGDHSFLQGETMGRPSVVETRLTTDGTVYVGGHAVLVAEGSLYV